MDMSAKVHWWKSSSLRKSEKNILVSLQTNLKGDMTSFYTFIFLPFSIAFPIQSSSVSLSPGQLIKWRFEIDVHLFQEWDLKRPQCSHSSVSVQLWQSWNCSSYFSWYIFVVYSWSCDYKSLQSDVLSYHGHARVCNQQGCYDANIPIVQIIYFLYFYKSFVFGFDLYIAE